MKILLTGASSYVGARLFFDLKNNFNVIGTSHQSNLFPQFLKLDTTSVEEVKKIIQHQRPDIIIHAAANANSRWCDANPDLAWEINVKATQYIADAANEIGAQVIFVSSYAATESINVYSKTKIQSEKIVHGTKAGYIILRPSFILGFSPNTKNDRPFNRILNNLDGKTDAIYDTSWKFQPTYLHHISEVIESAIQQKLKNVLIHIATPDLKSRFDVARDILEKFHVPVLAINQHDAAPVYKNDLHELRDLHLPTYSYKQMIDKIVEEIENRKTFVL